MEKARPRLQDLTICAADSVNPALAARALAISVEHCDFGDAILFTHAPIAGPFRTVIIDRLLSRADYSRFILKELAQHVATPFALVIQWDGYVVNPQAWVPEFLHYDYIGAKWPWHADGFTVGNGGFSLRSRRLLEACADSRLPLDPGLGEDLIVCRRYRKPLEAEFRVRFAPESVAERFSHERVPPAGPTFGFHGLFNLWRCENDSSLAALAADLHADVLAGEEYAELLVECFSRKRVVPARALYARLRTTLSPGEVEARLGGFIREADFVAALVRDCEAPFRASQA